MVCTFMIFVLPALVMRACYWLWGLITGRKAEPAKPAAPANVAAAQKGTCPYHVVLRFFGFKVPEKQPVVQAAPATEQAVDNRVKAE